MTDRPNYCLHVKHPDATIEDTARQIYQNRCGHLGGWWELNETPQIWWEMAAKQMRESATLP